MRAELLLFLQSLQAVSDTDQIQVLGFSTEAGTNGSAVQVALDGVVDLTAANITAETSLSAGQYYYLSKFRGEIVKFETASAPKSQARELMLTQLQCRWD